MKYDAGPLEIGFQARYLNDITDQIARAGGVPLRRRLRADRGAGRGGCQRAVRADADAGVARRKPLPRARERSRCAASRVRVIGTARKPFLHSRSSTLRPMPNLQARAMRREPTEPERLLWARLRDRRLGGFKFRRQHPLGAFVADFACLERRLIVEADGEQHVGSEYDAYRSERAAQAGLARGAVLEQRGSREPGRGRGGDPAGPARGGSRRVRLVRGDPITLTLGASRLDLSRERGRGSISEYPEHAPQKPRRQRAQRVHRHLRIVQLAASTSSSPRTARRRVPG